MANFLQVKPTFHKSAKSRPSFGLPNLRLSDSSVENLTSERHTISVFSEKKRPVELDIEKIVKSNQVIEDVITSMHAESRSPTEGPNSVASMRKFNLPTSTPSSRADAELSRKFLSIDTITQAIDFNADEDFDVMCVNCFEFLKLSSTDQHSKTCFKNLNLTRQKEFVARLERLKTVIEARAQESTGHQSLFYQDLMQTVSEIQSSAYDRPIEKVEVLCSKANTLAGLLLTKRVINLVKEFEIRTQQAKLTAEDFEALHDFETNIQHQKMCMWRQSPMKVSHHGEEIKEVLSDCEDDHNKSIISGFTDQTSPYIDEPLQSGRDGTRKAFYNRCLRLKTKLPKDHPAHKVLISSLFICSLKDKVSIEQWDPYIKANLGVVE
mmetsp:Transcript_18803/g.34098  ORF Transcript_18803/g.34098 Transcript_18803/m.34098 type:complete len:380 (+) Transcript_18803:56-1195(+)